MLFSLFAATLLLTSSAAAFPHPDLVAREVNETNKAGLAWPNGRWEDMEQFQTTHKIGWYYTWSPNPVENNDLEFVPMLWGERQVQDFVLSLNETLENHEVTAVLGPNEPELSSQSNLSPADAAELYKTYLQPLHGLGLRLGSPAVSSAPISKQWMRDFLEACDGCTIDFMPIHWYYKNATNFVDYIEDWYATFNTSIWVTEWACHNFANRSDQCTADEIEDFLFTTQTWMDRTPYIERYAWFGAMKNMSGVNPDNALMDPQGNITPLGLQYIGSNETSRPPRNLSAAISCSPQLWTALVAVTIALAASF